MKEKKVAPKLPQHNEAISRFGHCECPCHEIPDAKCLCKAPKILRARVPKLGRPRKIRSSNIGRSDVKQFTKSRGIVINPMKSHGFHAPMQAPEI